MSGIYFFENSQYTLINIMALLLLFIAVLYSSNSDNKISVALWLLFIGVGLDFIANFFSYQTLNLAKQGLDINTSVFNELIFSILCMMALGLSSLKLIKADKKINLIVYAIGAISIVASLLFVFVAVNGDIVNNMRQIFPFVGFTCVSVGFMAQGSSNHRSGSITVSLLTGIIALIIFLTLFNKVPQFYFSIWYVPALFYISLAFGVFQILINQLHDKIEDSAKKIEQYNQKLEDIIRLSPFPIILSKVNDDKIILANNNAIKLFGINPNQVSHYRLQDFFADHDNRRILTERMEKEGSVSDFEILVKAPFSKEPFWLLASSKVIDYNYDIVLYSAFQDITSRKQHEALLRNQAIRDPLTSLYNRRYFEDEVGKRILESKNAKKPYCVLMIDADHFKNVNDTYGHKVGDKVLIELSSTVERALRDNDIVARYGGEEFVVFLADNNAEQGKIVADRLRESVSRIVVYSDDKKTVKFTISIGVSSSDISDNIDTLIRTADEALYRAKSNGRNRSEIFSVNDMQGYLQSIRDEDKHHDSNHHPIFDKDNTAEISLLDGADTANIEETTLIEDLKQ